MKYLAIIILGLSLGGCDTEDRIKAFKDIEKGCTGAVSITYTVATLGDSLSITCIEE